MARFSNRFVIWLIVYFLIQTAVTILFRSIFPKAMDRADMVIFTFALSAMLTWWQVKKMKK